MQDSNLKQDFLIALVGRSNVGKSALYNRLLNKNQSILEDVLGTTRDLIEEDIEINFRNDVFGNSENEPRLKGNYALSNKEETIIKSGIFTTCKKNNKCPPWSLK